MGVRLGLDCRLYRNRADFAAPNWSEMKNVKDATLNLETGEADVSRRGGGRWRATVPTLKEASIEFEMVWDSGDADFNAIRDAFLNGSAVELAAMDGDVAEAGSQGLRATCAIINFSRNEPLEEAVTVSVTAKPTYSINPPTWVVVP